MQTQTGGYSANDGRAHAFRKTLSQFPTGVAIVTAFVGVRAVGMTVNSFSSVSLEPPLVLWSLRKASKRYDAFAQAEAYVINVLAAEQAHLGLTFASQVENPFSEVVVRDRYCDVPIIAGCAAWFGCRPFAAHDAGDHSIMVSAVLEFDSDPSRESILFYKGSFHNSKSDTVC